MVTRVTTKEITYVCVFALFLFVLDWANLDQCSMFLFVYLHFYKWCVYSVAQSCV